MTQQRLDADDVDDDVNNVVDGDDDVNDEDYEFIKLAAPAEERLRSWQPPNAHRVSLLRGYQLFSEQVGLATLAARRCACVVAALAAASLAYGHYSRKL